MKIRYPSLFITVGVFWVEAGRQSIREKIGGYLVFISQFLLLPLLITELSKAGSKSIELQQWIHHPALPKLTLSLGQWPLISPSMWLP